LEEYIDTPVKFYSSGMHARLAFAAAVCVNPDILLLDEVLSVGDRWFQEKCVERLQKFRDGGGTTVVVSHSREIIEKLCERAIWLENGELKMDGSYSAVEAAYAASR
jgi:ABC-type polysaccharide/polyol phosphate transport system ATPase subunit